MRHSSSLLAIVALLTSHTAAAIYKGFNYGSSQTDGSAKQEPDFEGEFNSARNLVGTSGFTSARLYTMIQAGTINGPTSALQAALNTNTSLLLGLWASAGDAAFANEIAALNAAVGQFGISLAPLIAGISVGSEDLYRITPTGIANKAGVGAGPDVLVNYIGQVRSAIANTPWSAVPVGHVDTWTAWVNASNDAVITAVDWVGHDAYPYFQTSLANSIDNGNATFWSAYDNTVSAAQNKPVWITETGWPVSGPTENQAVPSVQNAQTYWDQVGCAAFGKINTWWYTLQDSQPTTPSPSFGIVGAGLPPPTTPIYSLTC